MSDISNIGFNIETEEEFINLIEKSFETASQIEVPWGFYIHFIDASGAELWTQLNLDGEYIGFHPHFHGMSRRVVSIVREIKGEESELDGMFYAWANPTNLNESETGEYPFVFNVPDMKVVDKLDYPQIVEIQLTAFAQDLEFYPNEDDYYGSQDEELQFAIESFVPIGLFDEEENGENPEAMAVFSGVVQQSEVRTNEMTGDKFYWMLVDTLGGEVDVVASIDLCENLPNPLSIIQGQFWLSGRILN